ncbi:hypothetical protein AAHA92_00405 [Salvia divinorum]|uniref:RNase H type-1 domain-containing protein n=1 Tax=Salvia divinorum TaxID=28513 RepID=A0ABD1ILW7_SALDI
MASPAAPLEPAQHVPHWCGVLFPMQPPTQTMDRRTGIPNRDVKWKPPDHPWLKLNIDTCLVAPSGKFGGGGLIRNSRSTMLAAYSSPINAQSHCEVELSTILHRALLAKEFGALFWIESATQQGLSLINSKHLGPAQTRHIMARVLVALQDCSTKTRVIPRQGNKAAEFLAK